MASLFFFSIGTERVASRKWHSRKSLVSYPRTGRGGCHEKPNESLTTDY